MKISHPFVINRASKQATGLIYCGVPMAGSAGMFNQVGDASRREFFGTISGDFWVPGLGGGKTAQIFNGSDNVQNLLPATYARYSIKEITVSCWVKTSAIGRIQYLFAKWGITNDSFLSYLDQTTGFPHWIISTNGAYQPGNELVGSVNCADGR